MSNTLTSLIPDIYAALDVVSRELVGFIPSVQRDSRADRTALNQTLRSFATPANTGSRTITPAMAFPAASDQTIANKSLTITRSKAYPFSWTGEEEYSLDSMGPGYLTIRQDQIAQCFRAAANDIESDLAVAAYLGASRGSGTAGTSPFATNLSDTANIRKILDDNGAPISDRHLVINTTAGAAVRTLTQLTKVNEAGDTTLLRQGALLDIHGFQLRESAQLSSVTAGTGANYLSNNVGGYSVGATSIAVDVGSGTVLAGDMVTFAGDTNKYVVATALSAGTLVLAAPGLRQTLADDVAMTVVAASTRNCGFSRNAILLATRLPAIPKEGDLATDREIITDPRSGISFEAAIYPGYRMNVVEIGLNWGYFVTKPEHIALLLG